MEPVSTIATVGALLAAVPAVVENFKKDEKDKVARKFARIHLDKTVDKIASLLHDAKTKKQKELAWDLEKKLRDAKIQAAAYKAYTKDIKYDSKDVQKYRNLINSGVTPSPIM